MAAAADVIGLKVCPTVAVASENALVEEGPFWGPTLLSPPPGAGAAEGALAQLWPKGQTSGAPTAGPAELQGG